MPDPQLPVFEKFAGCLLGTAVGDSVGLPFEGLSPRRVSRMAPGPLKQTFCLGRGMVSDDTDHTVFVAQSLLVAGESPERFRRALQWRLRFWLACLPAGIGLATLRSILRMWCGLRHPGVYSAGNGPAMRCALIGVRFCHDSAARTRFLEESTVLTHTDPKALLAASAIGEIAARLASGEWSERPDADSLFAAIRGGGHSEWEEVAAGVRDFCRSGDGFERAAAHWGGRRGISGYALRSVPFAILAWYRHFWDFRATIEACVRGGGDTDTNAAIAGALAGVTVGPEEIPHEWIGRLVDFPHSPGYLRSLAEGLAGGGAGVRTGFSPWLFPRGILFTTLVLAHGFRRMLPPYG